MVGRTRGAASRWRLALALAISAVTAVALVAVPVPAFADAPAIITQPVNAGDEVGGTVQFTVDTSGATGFVWQYSSDGATWPAVVEGTVGGTTRPVTAGVGVLDGTDTSTLTLSNMGGGLDQTRFRAKVTNGEGDTYSNVVAVTVGDAPSVTDSGSTVPTAATGTVSIDVDATGPALSYRWQRSVASGSWTAVNNGGTAPVVTGARLDTLNLTGVTLGMDSYRYRAVVTNGVGVDVSDPVTLDIGTPVSGVTTTGAQSAVDGEATFTATAQPTSAPLPAAATMTWSWQYGASIADPDIAGDWHPASDLAGVSAATVTPTTGGTALNSTLALSGLKYAQNGLKFRAVAHNAYGVAMFSTPASLTVAGVAPTFAISPSAQTASADGSATFNAAVTGGDPVGSKSWSWQWQSAADDPADGAAWTAVGSGSHPGTGTPTGLVSGNLVLTGLLFADDGSRVRAVASNASGVVRYSTPVVVTVAGVAPTVTDPVDQGAVSGSAATFTVTVTPGDPATTVVGWERRSPTGAWVSDTAGSYDSVSGLASLTLPNVSGLNGYRYRVAVSNSIGSTTSDSALLTVGSAPSVTTAPADTSAVAMGTASFSVVPDGSPIPVVRRWEVSIDNGANWIPVTGAGTSGVTSTTLVLTGTTGAPLHGGYLYRAVLWNGIGGEKTSPSALLTVGAFPTVGGPSNQVASAAGGATFTVTSGAPETDSVQWWVQPKGVGPWAALTGDASKLPGLVLSGLTSAADGNRYRAVVTNGLGSTVSDTATLTVGSGPSATAVGSLDRSVVVGTTVSLSVTTTGSPAPTLVWKSSDASNGTYGTVTAAGASGMDSTTLVLPAVGLGLNETWYRVMASNSASATLVYSAPVRLRVGAFPTVSGPANVTAVNGGATFTVTPGVPQTDTVQWWVQPKGVGDWAALTGDASKLPGLVLSGLTSAADGNRYRAVVSNGLGSTVSDSATLTVGSGPSATAVGSLDRSVIVGATVSLSVTVGGSPGPDLLWQSSATGGEDTYGAVTAAGASGMDSTTLVLPAVSPSLNGTWYRVMASNSASAAPVYSAPVKLTVGAVPTVSGPVDQVASAEGGATFTVTPGAPQTDTVQWWVQRKGVGSWAALTEGKLPVLVLAGLTSADDNGNRYRAVVTNAVGTASVTSDSATLTVGSAPKVTAQPADQSVAVGATASFSAVVTGSPTPGLAWESSTTSATDGFTPVGMASGRSGLTSATLVLSGSGLGASGTWYRVAASNSASALPVYSVPVRLTVGGLPVVVGPANQVASAAGSVTFTVSSTGTHTVQWQKQAGAGTSWADLGGKTGDALTVSGLVPTDSGSRYRAVVTNDLGSTTSDSATLRVGTAPLVTLQPVAQQAAVGETASFSVVVTGSPAPALVWESSTTSSTDGFQSVAADASRSGLTSATLVLSRVPAGLDGTWFRVKATNSASTTPVYSDGVKLTVGAVPTVSGPASQIASVAGGASFTVLSAGTHTVRWEMLPPGVTQWQTATGAVSTDQDTLVVSGMTDPLKSGIRFRAVVSNTFGSRASDTATLTVGTAPVVSNPDSVTVASGAITSFSVAVTAGTPEPTLRWQVRAAGSASWANLVDGVDGVTGASSVLLGLTGLTTAQSGNRYRAVATNAIGVATSDSATLTVGTAPDVSNPAAQTATVGKATFSVTVTGSPTLKVQWQVLPIAAAIPRWVWVNQGTASTVASGSVATLVVTGLLKANTGNRYRAVVSNGVDPSAVSDSALLTVPGTAPTVSAPTAQTASGGTATFTVTVTGDPAPTLLWQSQAAATGSAWVNLTDTTGVVGSTAKSLVLSGLTVAKTGTKYRVVVTNGIDPAAVSASAVLTVS